MFVLYTILSRNQIVSFERLMPVVQMHLESFMIDDIKAPTRSSGLSCLSALFIDCSVEADS